MRESMIAHVMRADLSVGHKLDTLIEWGRFHKASNMIAELKKSQSGRQELEHCFAKTMTRLFVLGEAEAVELLLLHDLADVQKEMTLASNSH